MRRTLLILATLAWMACGKKTGHGSIEKKYTDILDFHPMDTLYRFSKQPYELGEAFGYVNENGDTIIPFGQFTHSFTDTITTLGIVVEKKSDEHNLIGINQKGQRLFEVYWFDNGPDYISEGLFRILRNGKIGFADGTGRVVIEPQFACAFPFSGGQAKVTLDCEMVSESHDEEHSKMESNKWFNIDKSGNKVK